jgi:hypothetical protein
MNASLKDLAQQRLAAIHGAEHSMEQKWNTASTSPCSTVPCAYGVEQWNSEQIAGMCRSEFAAGGLVVRAFSCVLDRDVLFVSDGVSDEDVIEPGVAVYRASELKKILAWRSHPQGGSRVHQMKEIFDAYGATSLEIRQVERRRHHDIGGSLTSPQPAS